ncbi:MAG: DUF4760 domain-containing protein [Candidatus Dormibacteria bacterium]
MPAPTGEDAHIYLQLLEMTQQPQFARDRRWVAHELAADTLKSLNSKHPEGSEERGRVAGVLGFYESIGALISRGLLHEDLFFDAPLGFEDVWSRTGKLVGDWQKAAGNPAAFENLVWLARRYENWRESTWRPKSEAIPTDRPANKVWGETGGHVGFTRD